MSVKFSNNAVTTLTDSPSAGATSFNVASASAFPTLASGDWTYVSLTSEVVKVTAISGTTFTCDAVTNAHASGESVELRMTAELLNDFAEDTEALPLAGGTMTGDVSLGDNVKAKFGASDDLEIYHDGNHSYITDTGTGNLRINAQNFTVRNHLNNESMIIATPDGGVYLYHNNASKLSTTSTGIDVNGTVTADDLIVDNTGGAASVVTVSGNDQANVRITLDNNGAGGNEWEFVGGLHGANNSALTIYDKTNTAKRAAFANNGDISFYEDTGTTPKFFWDASAESLGIGTTTPSDALNLVSTNSTIRLDYNGGVVTKDSLLGKISFGAKDGSSSTYDASTTSSIRAGNDAAGNWDGNIARYDTNLTFHTSVNSVESERMRIDSSGNLYLGTTATTPAFGTNTGMFFSPSGESMISGGNNTTLFLNRTTADGTILDFRKNGAQVGNIGTGNSGNLFIGSGDAGINFNKDVNCIYPVNAGNGGTSDGVLDLGLSGVYRFKDLNLSGTAYANTFAHDGDSDTYFNFPAENQLSLVGGGAEIVKAYQIAGAYGVLKVNGSGSATYPNFTFNGDDNTGMYRATTDTLAFTTGGSERMRIDSSGNVGIGTTTPDSLLDIEGAVYSTLSLNSKHGYSANRNWMIMSNNFGAGTWGGFSIQQSLAAGAAANTVRFGIDVSGNVGIGTASPTAKLDVRGGIDISRTTTYTAKWSQSISHGTASSYGSLYTTPSLTTAKWYITDSSWAPKFTVDSNNGDVTTTGNLLMAAGKGIDFSAATPDGTGSTGSEVLDDYEEGTWTPTFLNTTVSAGPANATGRYTKIGNIVHVDYYGSGLTLSGGSMQIGGLPFTVANSDSYSTFHYVHGTASASTTTGGFFIATGLIMHFVIQGATTVATWTTGSSKYLMVSGTYTVT